MSVPVASLPLLALRCCTFRPTSFRVQSQSAPLLRHSPPPRRSLSAATASVGYIRYIRGSLCFMANCFIIFDIFPVYGPRFASWLSIVRDERRFMCHPEYPGLARARPARVISFLLFFLSLSLFLFAGIFSSYRATISDVSSR